MLAPLNRAQTILERALADGQPLATIPAEVWAALDDAYAALDHYLGLLLHTAAIDPICGPRCSACCTDLPPILPIEALRMLRALRAHDRTDGRRRVQRAVDQTRAFQAMLVERAGSQPGQKLDPSAPAYRETQIAWRRRGQPCPVLGDDGNCSAYDARPLSCRAHIHVEDPAHCEPSSPRFLIAERPPLWGHPRECKVEIALATLSTMLGLPGVPNLPWGLARLHDHTLAGG